MATGRAIFQAHVDTLLPEPLLVDAQWTFAAAVGQLQIASLTSGDNTITVPAGTTAILVSPPMTPTATIKLKTSAPDPGITLQNAPLVLPWKAGTVILNASANASGILVAFF